MRDIISFEGQYRFLSNFWPCNISAFGYIYQSVEHAYVASKSTHSDDHLAVFLLKSPGHAKRYGRKLKIRPDFDKIKVHYMRGFLEQKFARGSALRADLDMTKGREIVEGNAWGDTFWGQSPVGTGKNNLGRLLMAIRDDIGVV
ncbi:MAG: hypothetical protein COA84_13985 [Robiginitomaculum sp.]|nr:MAG: hypothetical protein COA84_13985 [Robiginitomaculum sp.]